MQLYEADIILFLDLNCGIGKNEISLNSCKPGEIDCQPARQPATIVLLLAVQLSTQPKYNLTCANPLLVS